jgi:hypothetical protein
MEDEELNEYAEKEFQVQLIVVEEEMENLRHWIKENKITDFIVCIGNKAFFNFN